MEAATQRLGRQLLWAVGCLFVFIAAVWFGRTQLGAVAGRSVVIVGSAGIILALLSVVATLVAARSEGRGMPLLEPDQIGTGGDQTGENIRDLLVSAGWMAAFLVATALFGLLPALVVLSFPMLWLKGGLPPLTTGVILAGMSAFLWSLSTFLNLHLPSGVLL